MLKENTQITLLPTLHICVAGVSMRKFVHEESALNTTKDNEVFAFLFLS